MKDYSVYRVQWEPTTYPGGKYNEWRIDMPYDIVEIPSDVVSRCDEYELLEWLEEKYYWQANSATLMYEGD